MDFFFNAGLIFYSRGNYSMKKTIAREGTGNREFFIYLLIYSNKLGYLQVVTVLV